MKTRGKKKSKCRPFLCQQQQQQQTVTTDVVCDVYNDTYNHHERPTGVVYQEMRNVPAAIEQFQLSLNVNPDFIPALFHLGLMHHINGELFDSMECFTKVFVSVFFLFPRLSSHMSISLRLNLHCLGKHAGKKSPKSKVNAVC